MPPLISVIIPNYNSSATLGPCLKAAFSSSYENFEVIVVDDCSTDSSVAIAKEFPCTIVELTDHGGAARARNIGARRSKGVVFFFTDADCLLTTDALTLAHDSLKEKGLDAVIGGTYTRLPHDACFFSTFQSVFINYSETKKHQTPDYLATHALIMAADTFHQSGGFQEGFLPIIEDVEFSHRLRRAGHPLFLHPGVLVRHVFNFNLARSLRNAVRKSRYWTMYSINNRDLFADSGTASIELKVNVIAWVTGLVLMGVWTGRPGHIPLLALLAVASLNIYANRRLLAAFSATKGHAFALGAYFYYTLAYPFAVGLGAALGLVTYLAKPK